MQQPLMDRTCNTGLNDILQFAKPHIGRRGWANAFVKDEALERRGLFGA